jgi:hypothetical protein
MKIFVCNKLKDFYCIYSKEINLIFNDTRFNTTDFKEAHYLITCLSDERNYPIYGNMPYAEPKTNITNISAFLNKYFNLNIFQKVVIFYHTPVVFSNNVINICYSKDDSDKNNIVICPPSIQKYTFNNGINKKYFVSFKGNIHSSDNRKNIFFNFSKYNNTKNIVVPKDNNSYQYDDLITNSLFSIVIEGDLPWSYRFTEAINAGSIPIIIKPKNKNILAFDELLDYSLFSIVIEPEEIDNLMCNILPNMTTEKIQSMLSELENVNNRFFISRKQQMYGVLEILQKRLL